MQYNRMVQYLWDKYTEGMAKDFSEVVLKMQRDLGLSNDPVQPDVLRITLLAFPINQKEHIVTAKIMPMALKIHVFVEDNMVKVDRHVLELLPGFPDFVCGFVDHFDKGLQKWRSV